MGLHVTALLERVFTKLRNDDDFDECDNDANDGRLQHDPFKSSKVVPENELFAVCRQSQRNGWFRQLTQLDVSSASSTGNSKEVGSGS